ncbi:MAG: glutaminyl-peptide cyclotransferase [Acidobacteria bacterium]|nr:MAG: glutaminyl-peptide cyclotransferase [Acidobacteriota bacterium]
MPRLVAAHPHDPRAFTQGLVWHDGVLYESTGQYGRSELRRVAPQSGAVLARQRLRRRFFGEGLARVDDRLVQLTWKAERALVYDRDSLRRRGRLSYRGEGWGLAFDGRRLIMSDGSDRLTFRHPETFAVEGSVAVTLHGRPLRGLNELEAVDGQVWANVFQQDRLVRIDPASGEVTAVADAHQLLSPAERRGTDVLNGIAYDPQSDTYYLTGKLWPRVLQVRLVPAAATAP